MGRSKEGFSLFGIFDRTNSIIGRKLLKEWMLKPLKNKELIENRLTTVEYLLNHIEMSNEIKKLLKGIKDIPGILLRIKLVKWNYNDWINLYNLLNQSNQIKEIVKLFYYINDNNNNNNIEIFNRIINIMNEEIIELQNQFEIIFDIESSKESKQLIINEGYNTELDNLRNNYNNIDTFLISITEEEKLRLNDINFNGNYKYLPQRNYIIYIYIYSWIFIRISIKR